MRSPTLTLPKLGVGLAYQAPLAPLLAAAGRELDYVEVVPDILWTDLGRAAAPRYLDDRAGPTSRGVLADQTRPEQVSRRLERRTREGCAVDDAQLARAPTRRSTRCRLE